VIFDHNTILDTARSGIYYLRNTRTEKIYLGMTTRSFQRRWLEHLEDLDSNKHHNQRMQEDFNAGDMFSAGVLCVLTSTELMPLVERVLITYYAERGPLYNVLGNTLPYDFYTRKS